MYGQGYANHQGQTPGAAPAPDGGGGGGFWGDLQSFFNRGHNEYRDAGAPGDYIDPRNAGVFDQRGALAAQLGGRGAPQSASVQLGGEGQAQRQQSQLLNMLMQRASGQGPSIADMQMKQGLDAGMAQQQALASTGRGNAALGARQASQNASGMAQNMAGQGAMARLAETQGAQQLAAGALQGARGTDLQRALAAAQMQQQNNQFNVNAGLQQTGMNDQARLGLLQQQLQAMGQAQSGIQNYQDARTQRFTGLSQTPTTGEQILNGISSAGAMMFGGG